MILDAVVQFPPEHANRLAKLKKADIASEAERLAERAGWMPAVFKAEGSAGAALDRTSEEASADVATEADELAEALAA